jgi:hypothetical protein
VYERPSVLPAWNEATVFFAIVDYVRERVITWII